MTLTSPQDRLAGTWNFSAVHSAITFSVEYVVASFRGSFEDVAATLADGRLSGTAKVASVGVKDENLAAHLLGAEFFDADNHPEIAFTIDRTAFGVSWNADLPGGGRALCDEVELTAELEFVRPA